MKLSIPPAVTRKLARQILLGKKHSPTILFAGGVVGMVATTVTACKATLKVEDVLTDLQQDVQTAREVAETHPEKYTEKDLKKDLAYLYIRGTVKLAKLYGPSFILGVSSIAALTGSHKILSNRNVALTAAYAAVEKGFAEYRERVVAEYGEDKDRELRFGSVERTIVEEDGKGPKKVQVKSVDIEGARHSAYARIFDEFNPNWDPHPEYNLMFLRTQAQRANDKLRTRGHIFLNEVYDMLGLEHTTRGAMTGWVWDPNGNSEGDNYVDFGIWDDKSMERIHDFVTGREGSIVLDFNVDGPIYDKI